MRTNQSHENFFSNQAINPILPQKISGPNNGINLRARKCLRKENNVGSGGSNNHQISHNSRSVSQLITRVLIFIWLQIQKQLSSVKNTLSSSGSQVEEAKLSQRGFGRTDKNVQQKVIHQKFICYVSAFHLNVNDWFTEYEHIEIFNLNL